jgi:predicted MPP superfamily phosphohydrolase
MSPSPQKKPRIAVRRFAGTAAHAQQLAHLRVAHLTDLHFGRVTPLAVQRHAVELTNAEQPDLVVITGDFVCHSQLYLDQLIETLSQLRAPTLAVLGNHDYWSGADEVMWSLRRAGVEVLRNQHTVVELRHQRIQIVGLDDAYTGHADRDRAVRGLRRDLPSLGISHIAEEADGLWAHGVPLVLAGHTHGGQVTLARMHEITLGRLVGHRYVHGLYGRRRACGDGDPTGAVYVSAGIGAAVMPLRLGERGTRELAIFELGAQVAPFDEHHQEQQPLTGRKPSPQLTLKRQLAVHRRMLAREFAEARKRIRGREGRLTTWLPPPPGPPAE